MWGLGSRVCGLGFLALQLGLQSALCSRAIRHGKQGNSLTCLLLNLTSKVYKLISHCFAQSNLVTMVIADSGNGNMDNFCCQYSHLFGLTLLLQ